MLTLHAELTCTSPIFNTRSQLISNMMLINFWTEINVSIILLVWLLFITSTFHYFTLLSLRTLLRRANTWLQSNADVNVKSCETITWMATTASQVNETNAVHRARSFSTAIKTNYMRGLRYRELILYQREGGVETRKVGGGGREDGVGGRKWVAEYLTDKKLSSL